MFTFISEKIDKSRYTTIIKDINVDLAGLVEEIKQFCLDQLKKYHSRADYKEFLYLTLIILGGKPPNGITFAQPGAYHHARWMSKALYVLKIYLFQNEFTLSSKEKLGLRDVCIFIIFVYVKNWFYCPLSTNAPNQDLSFLKQLEEYSKID